MAEVADSVGALPPWVRAVSIIGFPAVLAGYLVWWFTTESMDMHRDMKRDLEALVWNSYYTCRYSAPDINKANQCISPYGGARTYPGE